MGVALALLELGVKNLEQLASLDIDEIKSALPSTVVLSASEASLA